MNKYIFQNVQVFLLVQMQETQSDLSPHCSLLPANLLLNFSSHLRTCCLFNGGLVSSTSYFQHLWVGLKIDHTHTHLDFLLHLHLCVKWHGSDVQVFFSF